MSESPKLPDVVHWLTNGATAWSIDRAWHWELGAIRNLLENAYLLQSASVEVADNLDSVLTLLTLGVEKTLKLALGCCHVRDNGGDWPTTLKREYGHRSEGMQKALFAQLTRSSTTSSEIDRLVERIETDSVWQYMILVLDMYGVGGRFHYLDVLAQDPKRTLLGGPRESWLVILFSASSSIGDSIEGAQTDVEVSRLTNQAIGESILMWRQTVAKLGQLGAFGDKGIDLGGALAG